MRALLCLLLVGAAQVNQAQPTLVETLESIIATQPDATVAVAIRDPATGTEVNLRADSTFHAASTMKVPVMIEAYRRAAEGTLLLDHSLTVLNAFRSIVDGSLYSIEDDSDDAIYERLGKDMTFRELIHQMMTVSSNLATNLLIDYLVADSIQRTVDRLGASGMRVLRGVEDLKAYDLGLSNHTSARALADLLAHLREGTAVSSAADSAMVATMFLSEFNEMIPAGLPVEVRVANKTGWITRIHHDAAIVYPPSGESYVLVILTRGVYDRAASADLGARLARAVHAVAEAIAASQTFVQRLVGRDRLQLLKPALHVLALLFGRIEPFEKRFRFTSGEPGAHTTVCNLPKHQKDCPGHDDYCAEE